jgi:hypothetical protein
VFLGNKNIHAINLVRIGVATCERGIIGPAKYKNNWQMKTRADLWPLYTKIMGYLKKTEFGEYLAMKEIFGEKVVIRAGLRGELQLPGFVTHEQRRAAQEDTGQ